MIARTPRKKCFAQIAPRAGRGDALWRLAQDPRVWLTSIALLVGAAAFAAALVWQGEHAASRERAANDWYAHTLEVLVEAGGFTTAVSETQRGVRGYLLTGDPRFLATFRRGLEDAPVRLRRLQRLTADNPAQQKRLVALAADAEIVSALSRREVELELSGRHGEALSIVRSHAANSAMTRVKEASAAIIGEEQRLLADRRAAARRASAQSARITIALMTFGATLLVVVGGLGWLTFAAAAHAGLMELRAKARERSESDAALLALFIAEAPAAIAMFDREMRYLAASRCYAKDYGLDPETELIGRSHYDVFPEIPQRWREIHERVLGGAVESCEEDPFPRADGRTDWVHWRMAPWRDAEGQIGGALLFSEVVTAQVEVRHAHAAAEARLNAIVETAVDAIVVIDERGVIQSSNPATQSLFGYRSDELLGRNVSILMPEPHRSAHDDYLLAYLRTGQRNILGSGREVEGLRKDGSTFPVDLAVAEWCVDGRRFFTGLMRDVTARRLGEAQRVQAERRELVVRELRHRINNMFTIVCSLVRATARSHLSVEAYRDALLARIASFGATQVTLANQAWTRLDLRQLLEFELGPYLDDARVVEMEGDSLSLNAEAAQNFAMIVHELATNAAKYGAFSHPDGRLLVRWRLNAEIGGDARIEFQWTERGGPAVTPPRRKGFGSTVIASSARALGGTARLDFDPQGLTCSIELAASQALAPVEAAAEPAFSGPLADRRHRAL